MKHPMHFILSGYTSIVVTNICGKYGLSEADAVRKFLFSQTYKMLSNKKMMMWEFSPQVIFELWECEQITGNPRNSVYLKED